MLSWKNRIQSSLSIIRFVLRFEQVVSCYQKFQTSQTSRQLKSCSVEFRHCLTIIYPWIPNLTAFPNIFACPQKEVTGHCYMSSYILCILKIQPKFRKYVICNWCQSNRKKKAKNTVKENKCRRWRRSRILPKLIKVVVSEK